MQDEEIENSGGEGKEWPSQVQGSKVRMTGV